MTTQVATSNLFPACRPGTLSWEWIGIGAFLLIAASVASMYLVMRKQRQKARPHTTTAYEPWRQRRLFASDPDAISYWPRLSYFILWGGVTDWPESNGDTTWRVRRWVKRTPRTSTAGHLVWSCAGRQQRATGKTKVWGTQQCVEMLRTISEDRGTAVLCRRWTTIPMPHSGEGSFPKETKRDTIK